MSRIAHPLTPASSADLKGQDGTKQLTSLQATFELPPPAVTKRTAGSATTSSTLQTTAAGPSPTTSSPEPNLLPSPQSITSQPIQASEAVKFRRRSSSAAQSQSTTAASKDPFNLPPPPMRSRKIIQMKPRTADTIDRVDSGPPTKEIKGRAKPPAAETNSATTAESSSQTAAATKKKQPPTASAAAGRKMARKTAHSIIERRRRSKMNSEFATLKNMIPACTGEMHKLAILQASIEYIHYLEDCVSQLKAQRRDSECMELGPPPMATASYEAYDMEEDEDQHGGQLTPTGLHVGEEDCQSATIQAMHNSPDIDMTEATAVVAGEAPTSLKPHVPCHASKYDSQVVSSTYPSPALLAQDAQRRGSAYSSATSTLAAAAAMALAEGTRVEGGRHPSFASTGSSPALSSYLYPAGLPYSTSRPASMLTSPALGPITDEQEASATALLMLNGERRGGLTTAAPARGISVRDLLSS